jgi:hypothetical protein
MYVEFITCYEATGQALRLMKFIPGVRVVGSIERPQKIYFDNEPAILYAHNNKKTKADKLINIRFYVVKEKIQNQTISLEHISTKKMIMDLLTKGLPPNVFREPMILDTKEPRQEFALKQKDVLLSLCLMVRN